MIPIERVEKLDPARLLRRDAQAEGEALRKEAESRLDAAADLIVGRVVKD